MDFLARMGEGGCNCQEFWVITAWSCSECSTEPPPKEGRSCARQWQLPWLQPHFTHTRPMPLLIFLISELNPWPEFKLKSILKTKHFTKNLLKTWCLTDKVSLYITSGTSLCFIFGYNKKSFIPWHCFAHVQPLSKPHSLTLMSKSHLQTCCITLTYCPKPAKLWGWAKGHVIQRKTAIAETYLRHQQDVNPPQHLPLLKTHQPSTMKTLGCAATCTTSAFQGCSAGEMGWFSTLGLAPGVKYSHSWMWTKSEASQRLDKRPEPRPGLGGSLFHDQLLHTCLGMSDTEPCEGLWALRLSLHPGKKKLKKPQQQK